MATEKQIKIIKRADRNDPPAPALDKRRTSVRHDLKEKTRDAVTIVTEWVSELRRKKAEEAAHGFQGLFGKAA